MRAAPVGAEGKVNDVTLQSMFRVKILNSLAVPLAGV